MRDVDVRLTGWRMQSELTQANATKMEAIRNERAGSLAQPPDESAFQQFIQAMESQEGADAKSQVDRLRSDFTAISQAADDEQKTKLRLKLEGRFAAIAREAKFQETELAPKTKIQIG